MSKKKLLIKSDRQIKNIRESGKYLTELLYLIQDSVKVGVSLMELENLASDYIKKNDLKGAFKGYKGYPYNLCTSVNDCIVHGIPDNYVLKNGDLLKIDTGVIYHRGFSDSAISIIIGGEMANPLGYELAMCTKDALDEALKVVGPGVPTYEYSKSVYDYMRNKGFNIIKNLTGHGVGNTVHEEPHIYNRPSPKSKGIKFVENMVLCFEPITAVESEEVIYKGNNKRNLYSKKGDLGAQWEYMVLITENGYEILSGIV